MPIVLWKNGDDGLTGKFFSIIEKKLGKFPPCSRSCAVAELDQIKPDGKGGFEYRIRVERRPDAQPPAATADEIFGACMEEALLQCADHAADQISSWRDLSEAVHVH